MLRTTPPPRWLWIGNSNTKPYITQFDNEFRKFKLCTKIDQFKGEIESAPDNCENLTFSGIDTIVADLGKDRNAEDLEAELEKIFSSLDSYRLQGMKIIVEPLMPWKRHLDPLRRAAVSAFKTIKNKYPGILIPPKPDFLKFTPDGVHLTERAGSKLYKLMYELSIDFFEQKDDNYHTDIDPESESEVSMETTEEIEIVGDGATNQAKPTQGTSKSAKKPTPTPAGTFGKKILNPKKRPHTVTLDDEEDETDNERLSLNHPDFKKIVKDVTLLKSQVVRRWSIDLLVSAGTKEELDKIENEKNMNRIVFSGIEIHDLWAVDLNWAQRLEKIKSAVADFIKIIEPDGTYDLGYVRHLNFKLKATRQILEVTMGSEAQAKALRKAYGAKIKSWRENKNFPDDVKGTSMGPSLTLATRVRIAILHALAKEIKATKEDTDAWVIQHVARPVLKIEIGENNDTKTLLTLGFAQAVAYYKQELPYSNLSSQDLYDAYSIVGNRFGQELNHYFVMLDPATAKNFAMKRKPRLNKKQFVPNRK